MMNWLSHVHVEDEVMSLNPTSKEGVGEGGWIFNRISFSTFIFHTRVYILIVRVSLLVIGIHSAKNKSKNQLFHFHQFLGKFSKK